MLKCSVEISCLPNAFCLPGLARRPQPCYMASGEGIKIEPFGSGDAQGQRADDYQRTHETIHAVHERLFELQIKQVERMADLSHRVASNSVQLLQVVAETTATVLGKTANGKEAAEGLLDLIKKIKEELMGKGSAP